MSTPNMEWHQTTLSYPQGFAQMMKMSDKEFVEELRFLAAAKLYELGRLTAGNAAQLADMKRLDFLYRLGSISVPAINLLDEEIDAEIQAAQELAK
jgi:predicted HTH domain antitoxin